MKSEPLKNVKHEAFAQNVAKGMGIAEAYAAAGYKPNPASATKVHKRPEVTIRIAALQTETAKRAAFTVQDMIKQLDEDRAFAKERGAPAAMISASMGKAKVLGMLVDKQEVTGKDGGPVQTEELSAKMDKLTIEQREALASLGIAK